MSNLSGQQINQSYQGLLKLSNSSTGITSSFQSIEDGLGNDTGMKISTNGITGPNLLNFQRFAPAKGGLGFIQSSGMTYQVNEYDSLVCFPFYDTGVNSYSSVSYSVSAVTSTADVVELGFYTAQCDDLYGIVPYQLIMTAGTLTVNSTGLKTTTFPSTLSFSGYGGGVFFAVIRTTNSGTTPTVKFRTAALQSQFATFLNNFYGFYGPLGSNVIRAGLFTPTTCLGLWNGSVSQWESVFSGSTLTTYGPFETIMQFPGFYLRSNP